MTQVQGLFICERRLSTCRRHCTNITEPIVVIITYARDCNDSKYDNHTPSINQPMALTGFKVARTALYYLWIRDR